MAEPLGNETVAFVSLTGDTSSRGVGGSARGEKGESGAGEEGGSGGGQEGGGGGALSVTSAGMYGAYIAIEPSYNRIRDFNLGWSPAKDQSEAYWASVEVAIRSVVVGSAFGEPEKVVLMGDRAGEEELLKVLARVLDELEGDVEVLGGEKAEFAAARGAAVMAMRAWFDPANREGERRVEGGMVDL